MAEIQLGGNIDAASVIVNTNAASYADVYSSTLFGSVQNQTGFANSAIHIMSGTPITASSWPSTYGGRPANSTTLVAYNVNNLSNTTTGMNGTNSFINVRTSYVNAVASGTATWFWWLVWRSDYGSPIPNNAAAPLYQQIVGTVGLIGSGADLQIATTDIVSGNQYRLMDLKIQFPTTWTY